MPWSYDVGIIMVGNDTQKELGDNECNTGADCQPTDGVDGSTYITLDELILIIILI